MWNKHIIKIKSAENLFSLLLFHIIYLKAKSAVENCVLEVRSCGNVMAQSGSAHRTVFSIFLTPVDIQKHSLWDTYTSSESVHFLGWTHAMLRSFLMYKLHDAYR
jgi:hypothetical protein